MLVIGTAPELEVNPAPPFQVTPKLLVAKANAPLTLFIGIVTYPLTLPSELNVLDPPTLLTKTNLSGFHPVAERVAR